MTAQYTVRVAPRGSQECAVSSGALDAAAAWDFYRKWVAIAGGFPVTGGIVPAALLRVELLHNVPGGAALIYTTNTDGSPSLVGPRSTDLYRAVKETEWKAAEFDAMITALITETEED